MVNEFNDIERVLISQNLVRLTDEQIADIIGKPVDAVRQYINNITGGGTIRISKSQKKQKREKINVPKVKNSPAKKHLVKVNKELAERQTRISPTQIREKLKADRKMQLEKETFKTQQVDYTKMISVRIDHRTTIYIKPGQDPEEARKRYINSRAK